MKLYACEIIRIQNDLASLPLVPRHFFRFARSIALDLNDPRKCFRYFNLENHAQIIPHPSGYAQRSAKHNELGL